jgi:hypothetical protein
MIQFIYFRYVDIAESIDAADSTNLDSNDLQDADAIPPTDILPQKHYLRNEVSLHKCLSSPLFHHFSPG